MGTLQRLHIRMPSSWDGRLATYAAFYHGLTISARENMDVAAGGSFLSLTILQATALVEKIASNQGWNKERSTSARENMDVAIGGSFLSLTILQATTLVEKIASNQGWNKERSQPCKRRRMHQVKEVDMLFAKLDLLMKKLDECDQKKEVMHIHDSRMTCEVCGGTGHIGSNYPEVREDANYINNNCNYHPQ